MFDPELPIEALAVVVGSASVVRVVMDAARKVTARRRTQRACRLVTDDLNQPAFHLADQLRDSLDELRVLTREATHQARSLERSTDLTRKELEDLSATVREISDVSSFVELSLLAAATGAVLVSAHPGTIYFQTGHTLDGEGRSPTIEITGNFGSQEFTFASGTSQQDIITSINQFKSGTGVSANLDLLDPDMIRLSATVNDEHHFVRVRKVRGARGFRDILFDNSRSNPANAQKDFGGFHK